MAVTLNGVVHGKHIDLDAEPPVPDGAAVIVRIERKPLTNVFFPWQRNGRRASATLRSTTLHG